MTWNDLPTPSYLVDEKKLKENLIILQELERETGCHVLLAQKAFSMYALYPMIGRYISGTTASGLYEARLGYEEMGRENHVFAPAYKDADMAELVEICDHMVFNSLAQYAKHRDKIALHNRMQEENRTAESRKESEKPVRHVSIGIRINPEFSTQEGHAIYDPCAPGSRLGITYEELQKGLTALGMEQDESGVAALPEDIEGLHFHTLCEQDADDLVSTFHAFEEKFKPYLTKIKWLNLGGGHHITRDGYQIERLKELIYYIKKTYRLEVYLEPGEAIALNAGYLVTEVMDIVHNGMDVLILDASAACHMPDVLEMPYRPPLRGGYEAGEKPYTYRLSSMTCLAGDVIGDYSFEEELHVGDRLVFEDMAIYSMVKNNTFNGMPLPSIALLREDGTIEMIKQFGYEDFKGRLS
ncbi:MAG: carboxynorspermidine decarboxylase [Clostridiales bacterium]|nr:carboxynorspermidine decarboxylase [Roseburia sp.]MDD7636848.1 carboxynorspermidine decarboxylase [Clostridiales bacterium]MDY4114232.1 carboxynorspermidine decarboxylase [Roseburia sp.]